MQVIETDDTYTYILTEEEWYGVDDAAKDALVDQCKGAAADRGRRIAAVFVQPDALLSISPNPNRHRVWHYSKPLPDEQVFRAELLALLREYNGKLGPARVAAIMREALG
jgi:hypothetical protein